MSRIATDWAWSLDIKPATLKLVLLAMADRADEAHCCFPSISRLVADTSLNTKTVQQGIKVLEEKGLIVDTGERKGPTQRVRVFRLSLPSESTQKRNDSKNGNIPKIGTLNDPEIGMLNDPEIGMQNQSLEPPIEPTPLVPVGTSEQGCANPAPRSKAKPDYSPEFEMAWAAYPDREGSNTKSSAWSAWKARIKEGVDPEVMASGVNRYRWFCAAKGNVGTTFVMQGQRFFGPKREYENEWSVNHAQSGQHHAGNRPSGGGVAASLAAIDAACGGADAGILEGDFERVGSDAPADWYHS